MPRDDEFVQAILASPDDDVPRLVYADWLEERGDGARAEFIRLQCELSQLPDSSPRILPMREREHELLTANYRSWLGPLYDLTNFWRFRRGFVEEVTVEALTFVEHGERFFLRTPLRHVLFYNAGAAVPALASVPHLGLARSLDFRNNQLGDRGTTNLVRSPHLSSVTALGLGSNGISDEGAEAVAASPWLSELLTLKLFDNRITDGGARALAASSHLRKVARLDLRMNLIAPPGRSVLIARFPNASVG